MLATYLLNDSGLAKAHFSQPLAELCLAVHACNTTRFAVRQFGKRQTWR